MDAHLSTSPLTSPKRRTNCSCGVEYEVNCIIFANGFEVGAAWTRRACYDLIGIDPLVVGQRGLQAVKADEDYVLTHRDFREVVEKRHRRIRAAFDDLEMSPAINTLPKREPPPIGGLRTTQWFRRGRGLDG